MVVPPGLVGGWECPVRLLMGFGTVPGFVPGWVLCVVVWVSALSWEGSWDRTIRAGSGTVPGFLTGWVGIRGLVPLMTEKVFVVYGTFSTGLRGSTMFYCEVG